jgi:hypothetical protein
MTGGRQQAAAVARRGAELGMQPQSSFVADVLLRSGLGQGLLMGAGDEVEAFFRSRLGNQTYDQALEEVRRRMAVTAQERPGQTVAAEIAGGILPAAGALFMSGGTAAPVVAARAAPLAARVAQGAAQGAAVGTAQGGVEGFLKGEGSASARLDRAAEEALTGGLVGGPIGAAAPVVGGVVRRTFASPEERAARRMQGIIEESGTTPTDAAAAYTARQTQDMGGVRPEILADLMPGSAVAAETRRIANMPGANRQQIAEQLQERANQQGPRIMGSFEEALGGPRGNFFDNLDSLQAARSASAAPLYAQIGEIPARSGRLDQLLLRAPDAAFDEARNAARYEGLIFPNLVAPNAQGTRTVVGDYTLRDVDMVKRGLDRIIERETDNITGRVSSEGRRAQNLKQDILAEADQLPGPYRQAREAWSGPTAVMDAMRSGQRIFNERAETSVRDIAKMTASEREGFVVGVLDAVNQRIGRGIEGRDISSAFRSGNVRAQIEAALGAARSPEEARRAADALLQGIEREAQMAATNRSTRNISATAPMQAQQADFNAATGGMSILREAAQSGIGAAGASALQRALQRGSMGVTNARVNATNEALRPYLFGTGAELPNRLREIDRLLQPPAAYGVGPRQLVPGLLADPFAETLGIQRR